MCRLLYKVTDAQSHLSSLVLGCLKQSILLIVIIIIIINIALITTIIFLYNS